MAGDYTILFNAKSFQHSGNSGLSMEFIKANLSHEFDRKIVPDIEKGMDEIWKARLQENPHLYNASKFRLHDVIETNDSLTLNFGLTDYKDFQCTNMQPKFLKVLEDYAVRHFNEFGQYACMSNPLYNSVFVESSDNCVVLFKRSKLVGESPGVTDLPGGHLEPSEVENDELLENMDPIDVVYELYYSAVREVRDEINVPESSLSWPSLLGIVRNNMIGGKPGACFYIKCKCSSEEIENYYKKGGPEAFESTDVFFVAFKDIFKENSTKLEELNTNLAVSAKAAFNLYKPYYKSTS